MRIVSAAAFTLLAACSSSLQNGDAILGVTLVAEPTTVEAGDSIVLTLSNDSDARIGYNLCPSALERQAATDWEPVPSNRICTMELRTLEPGRTARFATMLPVGLAPDDYRYITNIELLESGERRAVRSNAFRVSL